MWRRVASGLAARYTPLRFGPDGVPLADLEARVDDGMLRISRTPEGRVVAFLPTPREVAATVVEILTQPATPAASAAPPPVPPPPAEAAGDTATLPTVTA